MVSNLKEQEECSYCDSRNYTNPAFRHLPEYMLSNFDGDNSQWWQSENGKEEVYLQVSYHGDYPTLSSMSLLKIRNGLEKVFSFNFIDKLRHD